MGPVVFSQAINVATAWQTGYMSEVIDTGEYGDVREPTEPTLGSTP